VDNPLESGGRISQRAVSRLALHRVSVPAHGPLVLFNKALSAPGESPLLSPDSAGD
jgi:hypothetical protein